MTAAPQYPTALTGTVRHVHDTGTVVLAELDLTATLRANVILTELNPRRAARRWQPGDRITAWGYGPYPNANHPDSVTIRAHTVQRWRPGGPANLLDPRKWMTPRQRHRHDAQALNPHHPA